MYFKPYMRIKKMCSHRTYLIILQVKFILLLSELMEVQWYSSPYLEIIFKDNLHVGHRCTYLRRIILVFYKRTGVMLLSNDKYIPSRACRKSRLRECK